MPQSGFARQKKRRGGIRTPPDFAGWKVVAGHCGSWIRGSGIERGAAFTEIARPENRDEAATNPAYIAPGYLVFARDGALWAVRFDLQKVQPVGPPAPVVNGIADNSGGMFSQFAISNSGMLVTRQEARHAPSARSSKQIAAA